MKYNWLELFEHYASGVELRHLSREYTGSLKSPSFGSLRNYSSKNRWPERRAQIWQAREEKRVDGDEGLRDDRTSPPSPSIEDSNLFNPVGLAEQTPDSDYWHGGNWRRL